MAKLLPTALNTTSTISATDILLTQKDGESEVKQITGADFFGNYYDKTASDARIGVTIQAYDETIINDADIGVTVQAYDATIINDTDFLPGTNGILTKTADGVYSVDTNEYLEGKYIGTSISISSDGTALTNDDGTDNKNIAIGVEAGKVITSQSYNTLIGYQAGIKIGTDGTGTVGNSNTLIGSQAGLGLTSGSENIILGTYNGGQGSADFSGDYNTIIGNESGGNLTTGSNNQLIGAAAGYSLTTGSDNIFLGIRAGFDLTSGAQNILLGNDAGASLTTQNSCIFIGENAGESCTNRDNIAIGTDSGGGQSDNASGYYNVNIGIESGATLTTGAFNTSIGSAAGWAITTGSSNVFIGDSAGNSTEITGDSNIGIGLAAGQFSANGDGNISIGSSANPKLIDSYWTIAIGEGAGNVNSSNEIQNESIAIGYYAGGSGLGGGVVIGAYAGGGGGDVTTANKNVILGSEAGYALTTGFENTIIGHQSGSSLTSGNDNVLIGYNAGYSVTTENSKLHIANNSTESLIEGDFATKTLTINGSLRSTTATLVDSATVTVDMAGSSNFSLSPTQSFTLSNPTGLISGQRGYISITQDATGSRLLTLGTNYKTSGAVGITLTTTANALDVLRYEVINSTLILVELVTDIK